SGRPIVGVPWEDSGVGTPSSIDTKSFGESALPGCGGRALALSARDLLEPPQGLDVIVEVQDAVHGVQHHHVSAEPTPAVGRPPAAAAQPWGSALCMGSQPSMPNFAGSRPNVLSCSRNAASFCSACASAAMIGIQPSPSRAARDMTASDEPPNQIGIGRCTG